MSKKRGNTRKARKRIRTNPKPRTKRQTDVHHFYWEKKLYRRNVTIELDYDVHHNYHNHFMHNCKDAEYRRCHRAECIYAEICCYWRTLVDFGKRLAQDRLLEPEAQN